MRKRIWPNVQIACLVGFFVILQLSLRPGKPIPSERQFAVWAFRVAIGGACVVGFIVAGVFQKRQKATEPPIDSTQPALPPGTRAIGVTFRNTREEAKRCELFILFNRISLLPFFMVIGACGAGLAASVVAKLSLSLALLAFPVLHVLATSVFMGYIAILTSRLLRARFPTPDSVRVCTTSLTAEGVVDVMPEKTVTTGWKEIRWIKEVGGDFYVWKILNGYYTPRSAFESREHARRFHRAAMILWKSRGAVWPDDVLEVIDETQPRASTPEPRAADDHNPYAAPHASLREDGPSPYAAFIRRSAGVLVLEYLVLIPFVLMR